MKDARKGNDVNGNLFDIPPSRAPEKMLQLQNFRLEAIMPHVYDRIIGVGGIFPHHDQVPL